MEFSRETSDALLVHSFERGRIRIGDTWHSDHLIIARDRVITPWQVPTPSDITTSLLEEALALDPEILLIGTGSKYLMSDVRLIADLAKRGIGTEIMDTAAACRTYNVLVHEDRAVVAALYNA